MSHLPAEFVEPGHNILGHFPARVRGERRIMSLERLQLLIIRIAAPQPIRSGSQPTANDDGELFASNGDSRGHPSLICRVEHLVNILVGPNFARPTFTALPFDDFISATGGVIGDT